MNLSKLPWYGQIAVFVALSGAGLGAYWYSYAQPARESIAAGVDAPAWLLARAA